METTSRPTTFGLVFQWRTVPERLESNIFERRRRPCGFCQSSPCLDRLARSILKAFIGSLPVEGVVRRRALYRKSGSAISVISASQVERQLSLSHVADQLRNQQVVNCEGVK